MTYEEIVTQIKQKQTFLCVGLDTDIEKIPPHLQDLEDCAFVFNKAIIDATAPYCIAFKPNTAFYEEQGLSGYQTLINTIAYIKENYPDHFVIADAKRGDIGNTASMYAKAFFNQMQADAITVSPYMGKDAVIPFLEFGSKWAIVLGLTSNAGANDFQTIGTPPLYQKVLEKSAGWGNQNNMMFVVGATQASLLKEIRKIIPNHFLLVPGIGAQGGSLAEVAKYGMNSNCGLIVNSSRDIIYASANADFAEKAAMGAQMVQEEMANLLTQYMHD